MVRILSKKSFCFIGRFSDLIYILNNISDKKVTLKEFLAGEINWDIKRLQLTSAFTAIS